MRSKISKLFDGLWPIIIIISVCLVFGAIVINCYVQTSHWLRLRAVNGVYVNIEMSNQLSNEIAFNFECIEINLVRNETTVFVSFDLFFSKTFNKQIMYISRWLTVWKPILACILTKNKLSTRMRYHFVYKKKQHRNAPLVRLVRLVPFWTSHHYCYTDFLCHCSQ